MILDQTLTSEQINLVQQSPEKKILVTAGPGTGKTHVLVARLNYLIEFFNLNPGSDILVLSFSRAAVNEIRKRVSAGTDNVRYVRAYTFDSFATRLMAEFCGDGPWINQSYDGRIRYVTDYIKTSSEVSDFIGSYRHILVDELQDLVGERADFVKAILETAGNGFTLLGDPAQGIYNFHLIGTERKVGSSAIYFWLRNKFGSGLLEFNLTTNFRAKTKDAAYASLEWGAPLNSTNPDYPRIKYDMETHLLTLKPLPSLRAVTSFIAPGTQTAILCRTNGEALVISRELYSLGIPHELRRIASDKILPSWIGTIFLNYSHNIIKKITFEKLYAEHFNNTDKDLDNNWRLLKRIEGESVGSLDLLKLAENIRKGNIPDNLIEEKSGDITVSTVHKAKGLEFDQVVVLEPNEFGKNLELYEVAEETRVIYVALTRPKKGLFILKSPNTNGLRLEDSIDRWIKRYKAWQTLEIEVIGTDAHSADPAGGYILKNCDPLITQIYIRDSVKRGDPVTLKLLTSAIEGEPRAFYVIEHLGKPIGITTEQFGGILFRALKVSSTWKVQWPNAINGLRVEEVDTVAGTEAASERSRLGPNGIWLRVRVAGLGSIEHHKHLK